MFGTHALIFLDRRVMLEMAEAIERHHEPVDVAFGRNQWRWNCVLRKIPLWYQNDGHNNAGTFEYSAMRSRPLEPRDAPKSRQRFARHVALGRI